MIDLNSTLLDILNEFVICDADHDPATAEVTQDFTTIKVIWPDTSRVRLDIEVMSTVEGAVIMKPQQIVDVPGGENPSNPTPADAPVLTTLTPNSIVSGGTGFTLTIDGTGFVSGSQVHFGTAVGDAVFVSDTEVTMDIGPEGYAQAGTIQVSVEAPGGNLSNQLPFTIT